MTRILILAAAALSLAAPASAQPTPWQPERLTAGWTLTPGMVVGTLWDSNVTMIGTGGGGVSEWVTLVNPRGEIDFNGRHTRFNMGYSGTFEAYRELSDLNHFEQRGRADFRRQISERLSVYTNGSLTIVPTTDRIQVDEVQPLPFMDVGSRVMNGRGGFRLALSPRMAMDAAYRVQRVRFDQEDLEAFELLRSGYGHGPSLRITRSLAQRLAVGAGWDYNRGSIQTGEQTFGIHTIGGDVSYQATEDTTLSASGGISHMRVVNPGLTVTGPAIGAGLEHRLGAATILEVRYARSFIPSYTFGGVTSNQSFSSRARMRFAGGRASLSGGLSYSRTDPVKEIGLGFQSDSLSFDAALGYQVARWLRAEGFFNSSHQTTTARGDFDRNRIGVQFVTFKPMRID